MNLTELQRDWQYCNRCDLCKTRHRVVFGSGDINADLLLIGEGPGKIEDLQGVPFIGPAGAMLDRAMADALSKLRAVRPTIYITNVVACRPTDKVGGANRPPSDQEAWACWPRLQEIHRQIKPTIVVFLGKVAEKFCCNGFPGILMLHPSYILRSGGTRSRQWLTYIQEWVEIFKRVENND